MSDSGGRKTRVPKPHPRAAAWTAVPEMRARWNVDGGHCDICNTIVSGHCLVIERSPRPIMVFCEAHARQIGTIAERHR